MLGTVDFPSPILTLEKIIKNAAFFLILIFLFTSISFHLSLLRQKMCCYKCHRKIYAMSALHNVESAVCHHTNCHQLSSHRCKRMSVVHIMKNAVWLHTRALALSWMSVKSTAHTMFNELCHCFILQLSGTFTNTKKHVTHHSQVENGINLPQPVGI